MKKPFKKAVLFTVIALSPLAVAAEEANSEPAFNATRPGNTESPIAVPKGYFQIESELANYAHDNSNGLRTRAWNLAQTAFRYGIFDGTDVQLIVQPYSRQTIHGNGPDQTFQGFGSSTVRALHTFTGADGSSPAFGMIGYVTLPTASKQLRMNGINGFSDRVEGGLIATGSANLTDKASITITIGDAARYDANTISHVNDVYGGANLSYAVSDQFSAYAELYGDHTKYSQTQTTADFGVAYLLSKVTQLDAGVNIGINQATPDTTFFVGWSHRF